MHRGKRKTVWQKDQRVKKMISKEILLDPKLCVLEVDPEGQN